MRRMEAQLEEMLVGGWFQGERAKLHLRVESVEQELSCMASAKALEQQAFEAQKKELYSLAMREHTLRRICERRVQDLELEVVPLHEKLRAAREKLLRERANTNHWRLTAELSSLPTSARNQYRRFAAGTSHDQPSFGTTVCAACDGRGYYKGGGGGQLGVVERLLEENSRLGHVVQQLQREGRPQIQPAKVTSADKNTIRQMRRKGVGPGNVEAGAKDAENLDLDMALCKIEALTGMIRAQEEIESLLVRELDELKSKRGGNRESAW
eukprot:g8925.t1